MHTFFCPQLSEGIRDLDLEESGHAARVLRLKAGDRVTILDGKGRVAECQLTATSNKQCSFEIIHEKWHPQRAFQLHVAIAPTKMNDRTEWFLEKAVELGIESVTPIICERSERRVVNAERFEKVIRAAVKQSLQPYLPVLNETVSFKNFLNHTASGFIAHCGEGERKNLAEYAPVPGTAVVIIGPEGDFTPGEISEALAKGWQPVSLGNSRLRTETAAVYVSSLIRSWNEKTGLSGTGPMNA